MSAHAPAPNDTPKVLLEHHLRQLRLPTFLREYDKVARQCASESLDYPRFLLRLTELELVDRERRGHGTPRSSGTLSRGQELGQL